MEFDLPAIIVILVTSCLCTTVLIGVLASFLFSIKNRNNGTDRILSNLQRIAKENPKRLPPSIRLLAGIYVFISVTALGALLFLIAIGLASDLGFLSASNINTEFLIFISSTILLGAGIMTAVLAIVSKTISKSKQ